MLNKRNPFFRIFAKAPLRDLGKNAYKRFAKNSYRRFVKNSYRRFAKNSCAPSTALAPSATAVTI